MTKKILPKTEKIKQLLAQGIETRQELKYYLESGDRSLNHLLSILKISVDENDLSVENIWQKFIHKQRVRYAQLLKIKEKAEGGQIVKTSPSGKTYVVEEKPNLYIQLQAIKAMMEIDKDIVRVGQELGLIFKQPEMLELKLPPEIEKYQAELKELENEYARLRLSRKTLILKSAGHSGKGAGEKDIGAKAEDRGGEKEETKENSPLLAV